MRQTASDDEANARVKLAAPFDLDGADCFKRPMAVRMATFHSLRFGRPALGNGGYGAIPLKK
jgi:hypothetical protein